MDDSLYNKTLTCPACKKTIEVTKVKTKACIVSSHDTDFFVIYKGINPMFYDAWVCEFCGYAALSERFEKLGINDAKKVSTAITTFWKSRKFTGERNVDAALEAYKLALYNLIKIGGPPSDFAKLNIRLAWLYRIKQDNKEMDFLKSALKNYTESYDKEKFPIGKFDECTCMYMIAELNRRIGNYNEAITWFSKLISSPEAKNNKMLLENARDQYHLTKELAIS
ncbi:DUF2225 domain-containing protein [Pseudobacteroides cellulosolvens]|uniref:DUF2225 domain-containing protein n=1 Tax=Pseudobacteroides cellulosolvens ATCC 35603 = DSM 2933 TaxID=398512 RepID=A0A0L6JHT2_9FIRM|nr:DUF2225 domain-containing protein [Pseudobacteroides cellulosolvens]KNY25273.1 Protein of unknown function DUF2225 [Pseudobacteroides cellulosolvens ATCC 35603 = DSM 2933]